jgi:hypothetical protein
MKRFNFLLAAIAIVLTLTVVSCTTMGGPRDDYYGREDARVYGNRIYVEDPYRGTIVLERDPRTGRYYEVNSPYGYYGDRHYGSRAYGYGYGSPYYRRNNGGYNNNNNGNRNNQKPSEEDRRSRDEARKKVLGN